jgi:5-oxoprolinase (ATP-hydrolysing) subunit A
MRGVTRIPVRPRAGPAGSVRCDTAPVTDSGGIDLNADLGEGFGVWRLGDDDALLGVVSSANVACGFHAGDPLTMRRVCGRAAAAGVAVGAQVSYRDLAGFGRRFIDVEPAELAADVLYQLAALDGIARAAGTSVSYVKPHGALYNAAVTDEGQAQAVVDAVLAFDRRLPVLSLPGSALLRSAEAAGMRPVAEGFADRGYTPDGRLVPWREPGALVEDPAAVAERAVRMATDGVVVAVDGTALLMPVESVCVHGDTPGAAELARAVRTALTAAGVAVRPFGA